MCERNYIYNTVKLPEVVTFQFTALKGSHVLDLNQENMNF